MPTPTIDPDSPLLVGKGILSLALVGAATGGTLGALRAQNPALLALRMGLNGSVAGLAFFGASLSFPFSTCRLVWYEADALIRCVSAQAGIREYLISPVLVSTLDSWPSYAHRRASTRVESPQWTETIKEKRHDSSSLSVPLSPQQTVSAIRNNRVLDSCLAGGMAGGIISGAFRGARTIPAAFITSALITSSLQYGINSVRAARVQTLLARQQQSSPLATAPATDTTTSTAQPTSSTPPTTTPNARPTIMQRIAESLSSLSPVRKLSNEEYATILARQQAAVVADLGAYERWADANANAREQRGSQEGMGELVTDEAQAVERPKINVEQAIRELDGLERKIRALKDRREALEEEGRAEGEGLVAV
ncbi:hypothetical protein QFC21_006417 [Naganishia friedmannii]|uniref:Uncharacterized protein n=1 Tax=Naganishia friedmannii TaxID=89922 RepID=A0ACC2V2Z8_9TREE|nr:hypothetical protein QFC21_006417 [Naganishia friedmannii]